MLNQLAVFVENQPGNLRRVTSWIREHDGEFYAFVCFDNPEFGIFRLICDRPEEIKRVLTSKGCVTKVGKVIAAAMPKNPGGFDDLLRVLAEHGINLNYTYSSYLRKDGKPVIILNTDDLEKSEEVLRVQGFQVLDHMEDCDRE